MVCVAGAILLHSVAHPPTDSSPLFLLQRFVLWGMRNETVHPFNETVQQAFARVSALRDSLDGPQFDDQVTSGLDSPAWWYSVVLAT